MLWENQISFARIDNRLIHGQNKLPVNGTCTNLILVANDEVAGNKMRQGLKWTWQFWAWRCKSRYFTLQKTIDVIHKACEQHIFLVARWNPEDVFRQGRCSYQKNIGNMHMAGGRTGRRCVAVDDMTSPPSVSFRNWVTQRLGVFLRPRSRGYLSYSSACAQLPGR